MALFGAFKPPEKQVTTYEFVFQTAEEENKEKTDQIALKSAKAHGRKDPNKEAVRRQEATVRESAAQQPKQQVKTATANQPKQTNRPQAQQRQQHRDNRTPERKEQQDKPHVANNGAAQLRERVKRQAAQRAQREAAAQVLRQQRMHQQQIAQQRRQLMASQSLPLAQQMGSRMNVDRSTDERSASFATSAAAFSAYMNYLNRRFKRFWQPPGGYSAHTVKVMFQIYPNGSLGYLRLVRSCGNPAYDRAALNAVRAAAPFRPLPGESSQPVDIEYTFDYTMTRRPANIN